MSNRLREVFALLKGEPGRADADRFREDLVRIAYGHKCAAERYSPAEREGHFEAFRAEHLRLTTDELHAAKERYKSDAENAAASGLDARLRDYQTNTRVHYEERDGSMRLWPELSAEGKLGYLARDAVFEGATVAHFARAVQELLGAVPPAEREAAVLNVLLDQAHELYAIAHLIPDHLSPDELPLTERVKDVVDAHEAALDQLEQQDRGR